MTSKNILIGSLTNIIVQIYYFKEAFGRNASVVLFTNKYRLSIERNIFIYLFINTQFIFQK